MGLMVGERGHTTWVKRWTAVGIACCDVHPSNYCDLCTFVDACEGRSVMEWMEDYLCYSYVCR